MARHRHVRSTRWPVNRTSYRPKLLPARHRHLGTEDAHLAKRSERLLRRGGAAPCWRIRHDERLRRLQRLRNEQQRAHAGSRLDVGRTEPRCAGVAHRADIHCTPAAVPAGCRSDCELCAPADRRPGGLSGRTLSPRGGPTQHNGIAPGVLFRSVPPLRACSRLNCRALTRSPDLQAFAERKAFVLYDFICHFT